MKKMLFVLVAALTAMSGTTTASADIGSAHKGSAKAFYCTGCHGYNGMGTNTLAGLAGRDATKLLAELETFKKKKSSIMGLQLAKFSDEDLKDLAAYFASLKKSGRGEASYARDIEPVIQWRCVSCHTIGGEGSDKSGLNLTSYDALMAGTSQGGNLIVPGSPTASSFMVMVTRKDHLRMPFGAPPLSDDEVRVIKGWIEQGAKNN